MNDTKKDPPVAYGMRLGFKASLILTFTYWILGIFVETGRQMWLLQDLRIWMLPIARFAGMLPYYFSMQLWPVVFLGVITGGLIGELWMNIGHRVQSRVFALLVSVMCASIVVGLHVIYRIPVNLFIPSVLNDSAWYSDTVGILASYPFLMGVPSILYIMTGTLGSYLFWNVRRPNSTDHR